MKKILFSFALFCFVSLFGLAQMTRPAQQTGYLNPSIDEIDPPPLLIDNHLHFLILASVLFVGYLFYKQNVNKLENNDA